MAKNERNFINMDSSTYPARQNNKKHLQPFNKNHSQSFNKNYPEELNEASGTVIKIMLDHMDSDARIYFWRNTIQSALKKLVEARQFTSGHDVTSPQSA